MDDEQERLRRLRDRQHPISPFSLWDSFYHPPYNIREETPTDEYSNS